MALRKKMRGWLLQGSYLYLFPKKRKGSIVSKGSIFDSMEDYLDSLFVGKGKKKKTDK